MGLFFGNKKKKTENTNEFNKQQIVSMISTIMMNCRGQAEVASLLKDVQLDLQAQSNTSSEEVVKIDMEILALLKEVSMAVGKQQGSSAINKLDKIKKYVSDRQSYCLAGGKLTKQDQKREKETQKVMDHMAKHGVRREKSRQEELQDEIDEQNAKLFDLNKTMERLKERYQLNPNDRSIISQANVCKMEMTNVNNKLASLQAELEREVTTTIYQDTYQTNEKLVKGRTVSEDQMSVFREGISEARKIRDEERRKTAQDMSALKDDSAFSAFGNPFDETADSVFGNPFDATNVFGTTSASSSSQQKSTAFGGFDAKAVGSADMQRDINKTKQALAQSLDTYNDKIDDLSDELRDYDAELKALLVRREKASPSECLILDGQIDQLNAKRSGVQYAIKRYRNAVATLQEQSLLIDKLGTQQDFEATNAKIKQMTGGRFADFEGLSMYLKESTAKANEELESVGTAGAVAESEEINMNTFTGANASVLDASAGKDENKYDALKKELGLLG